MGIPENIDALLVKFDINQDCLARVAGVNPSTITRWRQGVQPREKAVRLICEHFGVSKDEILSDDLGLAAKEHGRFPSNALPVRGMPMAKVPLVGSTHAGRPELPDFPDEFPLVDVPQFLLDRDPGSYGLSVDGDCMDEVCPPGMVAVVQPSVPARSGDVVVATIDGAESIMRRMTVINGDLILSPESHCKEYENIYIASTDERAVHVEHVAYFQSREAF